MTIFLDCETQSEADLRKVGAWAYSEHSSTDVICVCWAVDDGPVLDWVPGEDTPLEIFEALAAGHEIEAFNVAFEYSIWNNVLVPRYGWPEVPLHRWRDTQAVACYYAMPAALDKLAKACGLKGKDPAGERLITKYSKLHLKTAKRDIPPEDLDAFVNYCRADVEQERSAAYLLGDLPDRELEIFLHDLEVNARGIRLDRAGIEAARIIVEQKAEDLASEFREITGLNPTQRDKVLAWFRENGLPDLADLRSATIDDLLESEGAVSRDTRRALQLRQNYSKASTKKLDAMARQAGKDGRARFQCRYHGAVTGRNTGTGFQPLNLSKGYNAKKVPPEQLIRDIMYGNPKWLDLIYGNAMEAVGKASRHFIVPDKGKRIIAGDFTSIEAVVNAGLAGEEWKLQLFRDKGDPYCAFASKALGRNVLTKSDPNLTPQDEADRQNVGKPGELAFGYQGAVGAWRKFDTSDRWADEQIVTFVRDWRDLHPEITASWRGREDAAIEAVEHPGRLTGYGSTGFEVVDGWLTMILIDGKRLWYRSPEIRMVRPPWHKPAEDDDCLAGRCDCGYRPQLTYLSWKNQQFVRVSTYGGKLTENDVQATSRQILKAGELGLKREGYDVILSVYDEIVCEVPDGWGSVEEAENIVLDAVAELEWASRWPISMDFWQGLKYKK
jgi:DNA polymerase bacteriophage-type